MTREQQRDYLTATQDDLRGKIRYLIKALERGLDKGEEVGRPNMVTLTDIIYLEAEMRAVHYQLFAKYPSQYIACLD